MYYKVPEICCQVRTSDRSSVLWSPVNSLPTKTNATRFQVVRWMKDSDQNVWSVDCGSWLVEICLHVYENAGAVEKLGDAFYDTLQASIDKVHRKIAKEKRIIKSKLSSWPLWQNSESWNQPPPGVESNSLEAKANSINDIFASVSKDLPCTSYKYNSLPTDQINTPVPLFMSKMLRKTMVGKAGGPDGSVCIKFSPNITSTFQVCLVPFLAPRFQFSFSGKKQHFQCPLNQITLHYRAQNCNLFLLRQ